MMGALPPSPRDLPLLFSRMEVFRFTRCGDCRTIDLLARRIGQTRGRDPSADASPEWTAAPRPPPGSAARRSI